MTLKVVFFLIEWIFFCSRNFFCFEIFFWNFFFFLKFFFVFEIFFWNFFLFWRIFFCFEWNFFCFEWKKFFFVLKWIFFRLYVCQFVCCSGENAVGVKMVSKWGQNGGFGGSGCTSFFIDFLMFWLNLWILMFWWKFFFIFFFWMNEFFLFEVNFLKSFFFF